MSSVVKLVHCCRMKPNVTKKYPKGKKLPSGSLILKTFDLPNYSSAAGLSIVCA